MNTLLKSTLVFFTPFFLVFFAACGGVTESELTEVGNPPATSATATISATTKALTQATTGLADGLTGLALSIPEDAAFVAIATTDYDCTLSVASSTLTCECPGGGSFTREFDGALSTTFTGTISLDRDHETTFADCKITTCGETVTLTGTTAGDLNGTVNLITDAASLTAKTATASSCAGMTADDSDYGFDMTLDLDNGDAEFSGNICVSDNDVSFDSIADLRDQVDPQGECEDFGP